MAKHQMKPDEEVLSVSGQDESFGDILSQFEQSHKAAPAQGAEGRQGTVVAVSPEYVFVDVGLKTEGVIPLSDFRGQPAKRGDAMQVSIAGRNQEGYYLLSLVKVARPRDWSALESAFAQKKTIGGVV